MRSSIRRRFLLLTALLIIAVMGGTAIFILWHIDRSLRRDLDQTLRTEALALAGRLEAEKGDIEFELEEGNVARAGIGGDMLIHVLTDDGKPLFTSTQLKSTPDLADWSRHTKPENDVSWFEAAIPSVLGVHPYRVVAFHARVADEDESHQRSLIESSKRAWVFVARSLAPVQKATRRLALTLTKAVLLATVLTLAGGYIIASYGTRPIREVADRIAGIEPGHPRLEIDASRVPLELDPIVQKTDLLLHRIDEELSRQRRLTADVAHDLRTPVAGVRALLDVCVQRERKPQEYVETIGAAQAALRQLSLLLDNVLTLARLDSNAERPLFAEVRLSDVIGDATAVLKPMTAVRQVAIRSVGEVDAVIPCDRAMLAKILTNLLANAVEYTSPNSLVTLAIERHETTLAIHVRDCGPGVPDAQREKIFDRFVRGDVARAGSANHSGLGLPIARGLARLLGGDVRLNPRSDLLGSDFVVDLPTTRAV